MLTLLVLVVLLEDRSRLLYSALFPVCLWAVSVPALLVDYVIGPLATPRAVCTEPDRGGLLRSYRRVA